MKTMKIVSAKEAYAHVKYKVSTYDKKIKKSTWETMIRKLRSLHGKLKTSYFNG